MFERRWYLIGRYKKDMPHKISALDRISQFEIKEETFRRDPDFDLEEMFVGVFGIFVGDNDGSAVEVLKPESLREELREEARKMVAMYQDDE